MTDIIITITGMTAVLALVIFIAYKGITATPKNGNQRSAPSKRPLQRPRKGSPNRYGLRELSLDIGCWFPSFIADAFRWIFSGIVRIVSSLFRWLIIIIVLLVLTPIQIQPASNGQLPKPTGGLRILNLLNKGWASARACGLYVNSYFFWDSTWYGDSVTSRNYSVLVYPSRWRMMSSDEMIHGYVPYGDGYLETRFWDFESNSWAYMWSNGSRPSHTPKEWQFDYFFHDEYDETVDEDGETVVDWNSGKTSWGEKLKSPTGDHLSWAYTARYDTTHKIKSFYRRHGRAPAMPNTIKVTLEYQLEDLSYGEHEETGQGVVWLKRTTRDDWEEAKEYNMSGTSDDYRDVDLLEHGEGLVDSETSGFVKRERKWGFDGMYPVACVLETCSGQTCTPTCDAIRRRFLSGSPPLI